MVQKVNESNYKGVIEQNDITVIKFWADWCAPCKATTPQYEALSDAYSALFCDMQVDENPDAADDCEIKSIPTVIIYLKGEEIKRFVGSDCVENLKSFLPTVQVPE